MAEDLNLDNLAGTVSWDHPLEYSKVLVGETQIPEGSLAWQMVACKKVKKEMS